jgi:hypothetical protein
VRASALLFGLFYILGALPAPAAAGIPFQLRDGLIWVKVVAGSQSEPLNFLLDSGAGASVLDLSVARALGLKLSSTESVEAVGGRVKTYRARGFEARCAGVALPGEILVLDLEAEGAGCHCHIDGLIGLDFLQRRIVQLDFGKSIMRFLDRIGPGEALPLRKINDALCVRATINGLDQWLRVDTGCAESIEWAPSARDLDRTRGVSIAVAQTTPASTPTAAQFGSTRIERVPTGMHQRRFFAGEDGLLGIGLLARFRVTIDMIGDQLVLEQPTH